MRWLKTSRLGRRIVQLHRSQPHERFRSYFRLRCHFRLQWQAKQPDGCTVCRTQFCVQTVENGGIPRPPLDGSLIGWCHCHDQVDVWGDFNLKSSLRAAIKLFYFLFNQRAGQDKDPWNLHRRIREYARSFYGNDDRKEHRQSLDQSMIYRKFRLIKKK